MGGKEVMLYYTIHALSPLCTEQGFTNSVHSEFACVFCYIFYTKIISNIFVVNLYHPFELLSVLT